AAVDERTRVSARAAATAPPVAPIAIEIDADIRRAGDVLAVLAPVVQDAAADVVFRAVGVDHGYDPYLARVDDVCHAPLQLVLDVGRVCAIMLGQQVDQVQVHLHAQVLARVVERFELRLRLVLFDAHFVADLDRPDLAPEVALAD